MVRAQESCSERGIRKQIALVLFLTPLEVRKQLMYNICVIKYLFRSFHITLKLRNIMQITYSYIVQKILEYA